MVRFLIITFILGSAIVALLNSCSHEPSTKTHEKAPLLDLNSPDQAKLLTIGGTISEITCALGAKDQIVATDITSTFPDDLQNLPSVGYKSSIKSEGILSTGADLILAEESHLSPDVLAQLKAAGVAVYTFENKFDLEHTKTLIEQIAEILDRTSAAEKLVSDLESDVLELKNFLKTIKSSPKVLFVYARGTGTLNIGGRGTFAEEVIQLAGGTLSVPGIEEYKPLTTEGLIKANPDYILFFDAGLKSIGGIEGALSIPGIMETNAGKKANIIAMDGQYISGFGPRAGKAIYELARAIHQDQQTPTPSL